MIPRILVVRCLMKNSILKNRKKTMVEKLLPAVLLILLWQLVAMRVDKTYIVPSPYETSKSLITIFSNTRYIVDILYTLGRIIISFMISFILGTVLASASYKGSLAESLISPAMTIIKSVPTMGIILLSLIWFGSEGTVLFVCSLIIMPLIYSNMLYGMRSFDKKLIEMGRQFGFSRRKRIKYIYWPSLKPFVNSAAAAGISLNMKVLIAAEVLGQPERAVGTNLFNAKAVLDTPGIFAWSVVVILLSYLIEKNMILLKKKERTGSS